MLCHGIACVTKIVISPVRRPLVTLSEARKYFCSFERAVGVEKFINYLPVINNNSVIFVKKKLNGNNTSRQKK